MDTALATPIAQPRLGTLTLRWPHTTEQRTRPASPTDDGSFLGAAVLSRRSPLRTTVRSGSAIGSPSWTDDAAVRGQSR